MLNRECDRHSGRDIRRRRRIGIRGHGANTTSEIDGMVDAYVGPAGVLTIPPTGSVTIQADSNQTAEANSYGVAVSFGAVAAAIGVSLGTATIDGTTQAYMSGTLEVGQSLTVEATNTGTATTTIFALGGGVAAFGAGAGAQATINFNPTVTAYIDGRVGTATDPFGGDAHRRDDGAHEPDDNAEGVAFEPASRSRARPADDNIGPKSPPTSAVFPTEQTGTVTIASLLNYRPTAHRSPKHGQHRRGQRDCRLGGSLTGRVPTARWTAVGETRQLRTTGRPSPPETS